jgi:nickel-dependent lactate racemase
MKSIDIGGERLQVPDSALVVKAPASSAPGSFDDLACKAMDNPLDKKPLGQWDFKGKKVAILVDDWGRPTPCSEFLSSVAERIRDAADITIITASGMHDPMSDEEMERKVGKDIVRRFRCVSHDAGDPTRLSFLGITPLGTPVWVNKYAAEADIRLCFGRIFQHSNYGYEGGYKMIVPGIASFETIMRDHSLNFSDLSNYGILKNNPSRDEADAVGRLVGIDFCVNFVMDFNARPVAAFGGSVEEVFARGVDFGQRNVWGAVTGRAADITLISGTITGQERYLNNPTCHLGLAFSVTKPEGVVIAAADYKNRKRRLLDGYDLDLIPLGELIRLHEKRDWDKDPRGIQWAIKNIRGTFYERRVMEMHEQKLFLASSTYPREAVERWNAVAYPSITEAFGAALKLYPDPYVVVVPDPDHAIPMIGYDFPQQG